MDVFLRELAAHAGAMAMEYRQQQASLQVDYKSERDLVTEADTAIERYLVEAIRERFPEHAITGEESGSVSGNRFRWVLDPIDGTAAFVHDQPFSRSPLRCRRMGGRSRVACTRRCWASSSWL